MTDQTRDQSDMSQPSQAQQGTERNGSLEPNDSRNVTGASGGGIGTPGGADQQTGGERWSGGQQEAQQQGQSGNVEFNPDGNIAQGGEVDFEPSQQLEQDAAGAASGSDGGSGGQQQQFSQATGQQGGSGGSQNQFASQISEHMEIIGADGAHVGTVDHVDGDRIKLTKADSGMGSHEGHHHYLPIGLVAGIEGNQVRLSATGANAYGMESEE